MRYNPDIHHRKSLRLKGWDYSSRGAYFITICAWKRECIFISEEVKKLVREEWDNIPRDFPSIVLDSYVLMPNHLHAIIWIENIGKTPEGMQQTSPLLGIVMRAFKSKTAILINTLRDMEGVPVWQRNFYEHIVRNETELNAFRLYIRDNPLKWTEDPENPENLTKQKKGAASSAPT